MNGFIIRIIAITLTVWASIYVAGCTHEQIETAKTVVKATTQISSDPVIVHSYPPYSEGASGAVTAIGMAAMHIINLFEKRIDKRQKSNGGGN